MCCERWYHALPLLHAVHTYAAHGENKSPIPSSERKSKSENGHAQIWWSEHYFALACKHLGNFDSIGKSVTSVRICEFLAYAWLGSNDVCKQ